MKKSCYVLFIIFITCMLHVCLYSTVKYRTRGILTDRVRGMLTDEETGAPVSGAKVTLYHVNRIGECIVDAGTCFKTGETVSDEQGRFVLWNQMNGCFFVTVIKDGYALYNTTYEFSGVTINGKVHGEVSPEVWHNSDGYINPRTPENVKKFIIHEAEVKNLNIELSRESCIEFNIKKKTFEGYIPFNEYSERVTVVTVYKKDEMNYSFITERYANLNKLHPGMYSVNVYTPGFPVMKYLMHLKKGETYKINNICDFTQGTVIYGIFREKRFKKPISTQVYLYDNKECIAVIKSDSKGMFYFGGLKAGTYIIKIEYFFDQFKFTTGEIGRKEKKRFDFEL